VSPYTKNTRRSAKYIANGRSLKKSWLPYRNEHSREFVEKGSAWHAAQKDFEVNQRHIYHH
jgi:hypothetical protein